MPILLAEDQLLTASNNLADEDGMGPVSYQWKHDGESNVLGTGTTYTLTQPDVGQQIIVTATYTDGYNNTHSVPSDKTAVVQNVNDQPTGGLTISSTGEIKEDETLTVTHNLVDEDGLGPVSYQWEYDGESNVLGTGTTYTLTQADAGKQIIVTATYTDGYNNTHSVTSDKTAVVQNVNDLPTGAVTVQQDGGPVAGWLATENGNGARVRIYDDDGGSWLQGDPEDVDYISSQSSLPGDLDNDVLKIVLWPQTKIQIYQNTGYTSHLATYENTSSTGQTHSGSWGSDISSFRLYSLVPILLAEDQLLTASNNLADEDGMGPVSYQWKHDGESNVLGTGTTYTLTQPDVGQQIIVTATYTDGYNNTHSVPSDKTAVVQNVNDQPTGGLTISSTGEIKEDETLTVTHNLVDEDGLGSVSYQWEYDGESNVLGTGTTYTLTQADAGKQIIVTATYTDGYNNTHSVTSDKTAVVQNVNDPAHRCGNVATGRRARRWVASNRKW